MLISPERRHEAYLNVQRFTEVPMLILSVILVPFLLAPYILNLSATARDAFYVVDWAIWGIFALELGVKTYLSPNRGVYLKQHWFDVLIVVVPFLRPLRVVRSARALRVLGALRVFSIFTRTAHSIRAVLAGHGLQYVLLVGGAIIVGCSGLVTLFESGSTGQIQTFDDGLWWALTTITTVGYGDLYPVTPEGKGIAAFLMLLGISLFSFLTANIAAFLVQPTGDKHAASLDEVLDTIKRLEAKVEELQGQLGAPQVVESASDALPITPDVTAINRN